MFVGFFFVGLFFFTRITIKNDNDDTMYDSLLKFFFMATLVVNGSVSVFPASVCFKWIKPFKNTGTSRGQSEPLVFTPSVQSFQFPKKKKNRGARGDWNTRQSNAELPVQQRTQSCSQYTVPRQQRTTERRVLHLVFFFFLLPIFADEDGRHPPSLHSAPSCPLLFAHLQRFFFYLKNKTVHLIPQEYYLYHKNPSDEK